MTRREAGEILAQDRVNSTSATSIFSPSGDNQWLLGELKCTNVSGTSETVRVFLDVDGTTYDQTTAIYYDVALGAGQTAELIINLPVYSSSANLAVQVSTSNSVNFTLKGYEITQ